LVVVDSAMEYSLAVTCTIVGAPWALPAATAADDDGDESLVDADAAFPPPPSLPPHAESTAAACRPPALPAIPARMVCLLRSRLTALHAPPGAFGSGRAAAVETRRDGVAVAIRPSA
jgi:hypothetical protein